MRSLSMLVVLMVGAGAPLLAAQESRLSVMPFVGYISPSAIYQHDTRYTDGGYEFQSSERLTLADAVTAGARIEYRLGRSWAAYIRGSYAPTDMEFFDERSATSADGSVSNASLQQKAEASIAGFGLGVGRWMHWHADAPEVGLSLGAEWQRFSLEKRDGQCASTSQGYYCEPADRWEEKYDAPSMIGGLAVRHQWANRLGVEAETSFTAGRTNTENFWVDMIPEWDEFEAPRSQWVRTVQASLGIFLRL